MKYQEIKGDLIKLALEGKFDVIGHGVNCFCNMGAGIAPLMDNAFNCSTFKMENRGKYKGDINKLGTIDYDVTTSDDGKALAIVNCYTQFGYGHHSIIPLDYSALKLCMKKINHIFKGKHIGLPKIGCGLGGGDWKLVKKIIQQELKDCQITIVIYKE